STNFTTPAKTNYERIYKQLMIPSRQTSGVPARMNSVRTGLPISPHPHVEPYDNSINGRQI
ncbi:MAG: hypothetical protein Q8J97_10965, partial [Flavobacteriaceae bacterium]|nr:hypothetical protein [Flavobacteriaceae bacterium]